MAWVLVFIGQAQGVQETSEKLLINFNGSTVLPVSAWPTWASEPTENMWCVGATVQQQRQTFLSQMSHVRSTVNKKLVGGFTVLLLIMDKYCSFWTELWSKTRSILFFLYGEEMTGDVEWLWFHSKPWATIAACCDERLSSTSPFPPPHFSAPACHFCHLPRA